jgi:hypothetical protein
LKWNKGDLFRYHPHLSIHTDVEGEIGIIICRACHNQYKAKVAHKTLWVTIHNMEKL